MANNSSLTVLLFVVLSGTIKLGSCSNNFTASCIEHENKSLLQFKASLTDPLGSLSSWNSGDDCCQWPGVRCNTRTGHVLQLHLQLYALSGQINPSITDLKYLNYLDLSMNNFEGTQIPKFLGSLAKLRHLNLSGSSFSGKIPPTIRNLSELRSLDLSSYTTEQVSNDLRWLSGLVSLRYLNLGGLDLSVAASHWLQSINALPFLHELHLPQCQLLDLPFSLPFVNFTSLTILDLSNNGFDSKIPVWLFNLSTLEHLDLSDNNVHGTLPDALAELNSLRTLDLSSNSGIEGGLPRSLGHLCELETLALSSNNITGGITEFIEGISECTNHSLQTLDLVYNELTGTIPNSLGSLKNLRQLRFQHNSFTGSIPETIGNLSFLEELSLGYNQMSGSIPRSLGNLSSLVTLDLFENSWEGIITETHLMNLHNLQEISIGKNSGNSVGFEISPDWIPPFKLNYMMMKRCKLGPGFPTWLRNQNELITVIINYANISDSIPDWFSNLGLRLNALDLMANNLSGKLPNSLQFDYQSNVDLSDNSFEGLLPLWSSNVSKLSLWNNFFYGPIPSSIGLSMPLLVELDISSNSLNGTIPLSIRNLTSLMAFDIAGNQLSGNIPDFWGNIPFLYLLDMSSNRLSGNIPGSIGSLTGLRFLTLSGNNLSGKLPSSWGNFSYMASLNLGYNELSGEVPSWVVGKGMPELVILSMRNNLLTGNVTSQICSFSKLHILDLSDNRLSGIIPPCLGDLNGFKRKLGPEDPLYEGHLNVVAKGRMLHYFTTLYLVNSIDLSNNNFSGEIPEGIMNLLKLGTLNLSMNHLSGRIPESIWSLKRLETLDFSMNQLSGSIPQGMSSMTFLNHLNLSYNNLSGRIPTGNQFQTLNDPSIYVGNKELCGAPLSIQCGVNKTDIPSSSGEVNGDSDKLEKLWFYLVIGLGYFLGFWGVFGSLIFKKEWRLVYFRFIEGIIIACLVKCKNLRQKV